MLMIILNARPNSGIVKRTSRLCEMSIYNGFHNRISRRRRRTKSNKTMWKSSVIRAVRRWTCVRNVLQMKNNSRDFYTTLIDVVQCALYIYRMCSSSNGLSNESTLFHAEKGRRTGKFSDEKRDGNREERDADDASCIIQIIKLIRKMLYVKTKNISRTAQNHIYCLRIYF